MLLFVYSYNSLFVKTVIRSELKPETSSFKRMLKKLKHNYECKQKNSLPKINDK